MSELQHRGRVEFDDETDSVFRQLIHTLLEESKYVEVERLDSENSVAINEVVE